MDYVHGRDRGVAHAELLEIEDGIYRSMSCAQEPLSSCDAQEGTSGATANDFAPSSMLSRSLSAVSTKTDISVSDVETNVLDKKPFGLKDLTTISSSQSAARSYYVVGLTGACTRGFLTPASALMPR
ncbi:ABC transporter B member 10 [Phytophthora pseudosyringae]|uniref:ABC transporter B member 10 n=1 Tax=Phytophthora pseudosyringae TaxID=221518 RepID=A0A8T1VK99_9STRA|nr:ABC transporter B member 10 [Phytophthora pseudosyringae]